MEVDGWLLDLPEIENIEQLYNRRIRDVAVQNVYLDEMRFWSERGVNIGHA